MPYDGETCNEEPFKSFFAGLLLTKRKIGYFEYYDMKHKFEKKYSVEISGDDRFALSIAFEKDHIYLINNYNDIVKINGKYMTVEDYLYSLTSPRTREFLGLKERKKIIGNNISAITRVLKKFRKI